MPEAPVASPTTILAPTGNQRRERRTRSVSPWPVLGVADVAEAAADGDLTRMAARRVARLVHPLDEMRGNLPVEVLGELGRRITFTPDLGGRLHIRVGGANGELQIQGIAELRAYAQVLSAFVAAFDAHDAVAEYHEQADALVKSEAAATKRTRRRRTTAA